MDMASVRRLWLVIVAAVLSLVACQTEQPAASPIEAGPINVPAVRAAPVRAQDPLPPPVIVTLPADAFELTINPEAAANQSGALVSGGLVEYDAPVTAEIERLLDDIYSGRFHLEPASGGTDPSTQVSTTYTYSDMNGDGVEDLVIIIVPPPGDYSSIVAGESRDIPVIQIVPVEGNETLAEGSPITIEELIALNQGQPVGENAYLITLNLDDLAQ